MKNERISPTYISRQKRNEEIQNTAVEAVSIEHAALANNSRRAKLIVSLKTQRAKREQWQAREDAADTEMKKDIALHNKLKTEAKIQEIEAKLKPLEDRAGDLEDKREKIDDKTKKMYIEKRQTLN